MADTIAGAYDPEAFRAAGHRVVDMLAQYLADQLAGKGGPVLHGKSPDEVDRLLAGRIGAGPAGDPVDWFGEALRLAHHLHHPGYVGHQVAPPLPLAGLGEMVSALLNNGMAVYDMGPANVIFEQRVVRRLCQAVGWGAEADGILTHGGSVGNLTALLAARQAMAGYDAWTEGNREPLAILASAQNHYCVDRAVRLMGWGRAGLVEVEVDERYRLRPEALLPALQRAQATGRRVIAVVASACTTSTGSFDPIEPIADFCEEHGLWLHVDGAHGASFLLSDRLRARLAGVERADSLVWDLHKMMLMPALVTAVLYRDGRRSYEAFHQEASYLFAGEDPAVQWFNLGQRTLECTKRGLGATAYLLLRTYGTAFFAEYMERMCDLAQGFAERIRSSSDFELATEPQANIVCFRRKIEGSLESQNAFQRQIRQAVVDQGDFYLVQTTLGGRVYLRTTLIHPMTDLARLDHLLDQLLDQPLAQP
ncbi:MAG TPA: aminotransferase class I/II-fold pyridoxal phosphate-dependent enzyme [Planctomycetota bacterium]|nr:aminotransferase class I/II-fold pyridoxal phosphate-dependent enzyme [Planctomycetota bacterium]